MANPSPTEQALEKAMFRCVLKPLKAQVDGALSTLHDRDGSSQRMAESLQRARERSPLELFGVQVNVPDTQGIEKVRQKLSMLQRAYSPIDKVLLILQVCKLIYKSMNKDKRKCSQSAALSERIFESLAANSKAFTLA